MKPFPKGSFPAVVADPPWSFNDKGTRLAPSYKGRQRKAGKHYDVLPLEAICALPVPEIRADDAYLFLWIPAALRESPCWAVPTEDGNVYVQKKTKAKNLVKGTAFSAHELGGYHKAVMAAWGFKPTGAEIVWVKGRLDLHKKLGGRGVPIVEPHVVYNMGGGHTVRNAHEVCVVGRRGRPTRLSRGVLSVIMEPRGEHSAKPNGFYEAVERLCPGPYVDLYGRTPRENWVVWGDQAGG